MASEKPKTATWVDALVSCVIPLAGIIVGSLALVRGQTKRGLIMLAIGLAWVGLIALNSIAAG